MAKESPLTQKQSKFVEEFMKCNNASDAYRRSYNCENMKPASIHRAAKGVLDNSKVAARLASIRARAEEIAAVDASYILKRLRQIDELDVLDIFDDEFRMRPLGEWPKAWRQSISGIDVSSLRKVMASGGDPEVLEEVIKKIKWPDKTKNLELLGKHVDVQAFKDKVDVTGKLTLEDLVCGAGEEEESK